MKTTYKVTFMAEMDDEDIRMAKRCFFQAMEESMDIKECWGLTIEPHTDEHLND